MINLIPNQPIVFKGKESDSCNQDQVNCLLVRLNDKLCFQERQTSCLPQLLCNNDFSNFGVNLLPDTTGTFDVSSDIENWVADEDTWYWDSYSKKMCTIDSHAGSKAEWDLNPYDMSGSCTYSLRFTISGHDDDSGLSNDILTVDLPDGEQEVIVNNGTYNFSTGTGSSFGFTPSANWQGCIDDVSLSCGGVCWDIDFPQFAILSGQGLCKKAGGAINITEQTPSLVIGKYYTLKVRVFNLTAGTAEFFLGNQSIGTVTGNGIFTLSGIADATGFNFNLSSDFDGCIVRLDLYMLSQDYTLKLKNATNDVLIKDLTSEIVYTHDLIECCILYDEAMLGLLIGGFVNNEICMYLELESPTDGDIILNGALTVTNNASVFDDWGILGSLDYETILDQIIIKGGTGYFLQCNLDDSGPFQGNTYYLSFDIKCLDNTTDEEVTVFDSFSASVGCAADGTGGNPAFTINDYPKQAGHYVYKVVAGSDGNCLSFYFDDSIGLKSICLDNIRLTTTACPKELYTSNCIKFGNEIEGVKAWGDSKWFTACNEDGYSLGFDWTTGFKLMARIPSTISPPSYATNKEESYLFSNGTRKRVYAELAKRFDLLIHAIDELQHDFIRTMLKCDILFIDNDYSLSDRYVCLDNEYSPEWGKKEYSETAEARVEIQKWDNVLFNTNCG